MRAAIYARVSTDAQERDGTSLDTQIAECEAFAASRGWTVAARIRDAASGFVLERRGLDVLRGRVRGNEVDVVLAHAVDRLSRNQNHIGVLFDEIVSAGLTLEFVTETFEDTAIGRFILAARAFVAEIEREKISERTMRGKVERAKSGRLPQGTGKGMYGYRYIAATGQREVVPSQATVVRRLFQEFAAGASIVGLANMLNDEGILTFQGKKWQTATVFHLLRNPVYAGRTFYRRTKVSTIRDPQTGRRRRKVVARPREDWIEVEGAAEALVPESIWEAVQARLDDPERLRMGNRKASYGLAGHIRCSICGRSMVGQTLQGSYRYYRCRNAFAGPRHQRCKSRYVRADVLESSVQIAVADVLARPEIVSAELLRLRDSFKEEPSVREQEMARLEDERQRVLRQYQTGEVDDRFLEEELARIRREKDRLGKLPAPRNVGQPDIEDLPAICKAARTWLTEAAGDDVKLIADALSLEVRANRESAELVGSIPVFTHHWTNIGMTTCT